MATIQTSNTKGVILCWWG